MTRELLVGVLALASVAVALDAPVNGIHKGNDLEAPVRFCR